MVIFVRFVLSSWLIANNAYFYNRKYNFPTYLADRHGSHMGDFSNNLINIGSNKSIRNRLQYINPKKTFFPSKCDRKLAYAPHPQLFLALFLPLEYGIAIICFISISMQPMFNRINNMEYSYCLTVCEIFLPYWQ